MSLTLAGGAAIFAAGLGAGTMNSVAGAGSLITFPTLLALGYGSVVANVSNTVGLVPGVIAGSFGYRRELAGNGGAVRLLLPFAVLGGITGGVLLLVLSSAVFDAVVPGLVIGSALLVLVSPRLSSRLAARRKAGGTATRVGIALGLAVFATGVYGGYFGAAQGVLLIGILGIGLPLGLQQCNAIKNVLAGSVNGVAAVYFVVASDVAWVPALLIAAGSIVGGTVGSRYGRRLHPQVLRVIIIVVGLVVGVTLYVT